MSHAGDLQYFVEAVFNHPTLGEAPLLTASSRQAPLGRPARSLQT
ncbi:MAG TPA: hypothetical protein VM753_17445 [Anaeromyxobacter sp.]|jgi:hypothetical protein|nr:hypothetical protein [Anaeromyxobacter sp.]